MALEDVIFSAGGGFLFGVVVGFALKKLMKLAALVLGLFVVGLAYLSYKGWIDVKWIAIENNTKSTLINMTNEAVHILNHPASHFQDHPSVIGSVGLPIAAAFGFMPGLIFGLKRGCPDRVIARGGKMRIIQIVKLGLGVGGTTLMMIAVIGSFVHG